MGYRYYYFQDGLCERGKPIITYIGRETFSSSLLTQDKLSELKRRFLALSKNGVEYRFRHPATDPDYDSKYMSHIRDAYTSIKNSSEGEMDTMSKELFVKYVHTTNAIENNTLSESEVSLYLYSDVKPKDKLQNELQQTRNHLDVKNFLDGYDASINESLIKKIHELMMKNVDGYNDYSDKPGRYRSKMVLVRDLQVPKAEDIPQLVEKLINNYYFDITQKIHPIECMAIFHHEFERIHPFRDGNGRTGRAILDYMLRLHGFPPIYIPLKLRESYFSSLREGNVIRNYSPLVNFVVARIIATLMFIASKTGLRWVMLSEEYEKLFSREFGADAYKKLASAIMHFASHEAEDL